MTCKPGQRAEGFPRVPIEKLHLPTLQAVAPCCLPSHPQPFSAPGFLGSEKSGSLRQLFHMGARVSGWHLQLTDCRPHSPLKSPSRRGTSLGVWAFRYAQPPAA